MVKMRTLHPLGADVCLWIITHNGSNNNNYERERDTLRDSAIVLILFSIYNDTSEFIQFLFIIIIYIPVRISGEEDVVPASNHEFFHFALYYT